MRIIDNENTRKKGIFDSGLKLHYLKEALWFID